MRQGVKFGCVVVVAAVVAAGYFIFSDDPDIASTFVATNVATTQNAVSTSASVEVSNQQASSQVTRSANETKKPKVICEDPSAFAAISSPPSNDELVSNLEQLDTIEARVAAILLQEKLTPLEQMQKIHQLSEDNPQHPLLAYDALSQCTSGEIACSNAFIQQALVSDPQNGALWMLAALYHLQNQQQAIALTELSKAIDAPTFHNYWGDHYKLLYSAYAQAVGSDSPTAAINVFGAMAALQMPNYGVLSKYCKEGGQESAQAQQQCLQLGQRLEQSDDSTLYVQFFALSLQQAVYQQLDDAAALHEITAKRTSLSTLIQDGANAQLLTVMSRRRTHDWIDNLGNAGEYHATVEMVKDTKALLADPSFDPCAVDW